MLVECGNCVTRPAAVSSITGESASPGESAFAASVTPTRAVAPWAPEVTTNHDWFENASPKVGGGRGINSPLSVSGWLWQENLNACQMPFRLNCKHVLLTYSQCTAADGVFSSPDRPHYGSICSSFGTPDVYRLSREQHADGEYHYHAYISWSEPIHTRDQSAFDFGGAHPNIQRVGRTPRLAWEYVGKNGDILFECGDPSAGSGTVGSGRDGIWRDALSRGDQAAFLQTVRELAPRDYVLYNEAITRFADRYYRTPPPTYSSPLFRTLRPAANPLIDWFVQSGVGSAQPPRGRPRSLIIWGPTRTGKTVWARSLGRYV